MIDDPEDNNTFIEIDEHERMPLVRAAELLCRLRAEKDMAGEPLDTEAENDFWAFMGLLRDDERESVLRG